MNLWSLLVNSRIWPTDVLNRCLNMLLMDVDIRGLATAAFGYRDFRFRFLVQNLELTVSSLYQVYNRVFTSIYVYINEFGVQMTCVSSLSFHPARSRKYQVSWSFWLLKLPWGTTHSLRPEGPEWTMWASWHAVTASSCHVWQMLQELFLPSECFLLEALQSNAN